MMDTPWDEKREVSSADYLASQKVKSKEFQQENSLEQTRGPLKAARLVMQKVQP